MVWLLNTPYVYFRVYLHVPFLVMNKQLKITIIVQKQFIASAGRGVAERGSIILFVFSLHPETNSKCYKAREFPDNDVAWCTKNSRKLEREIVCKAKEKKVMSVLGSKEGYVWTLQISVHSMNHSGHLISLFTLYKGKIVPIKYVGHTTRGIAVLTLILLWGFVLIARTTLGLSW